MARGFEKIPPFARWIADRLGQDTDVEPRLHLVRARRLLASILERNAARPLISCLTRARCALLPMSPGWTIEGAGGEGGIRTPDRLAPMPHFECGAFNHSATSPWVPKQGRFAPVVGAVF